MSGRAATTVRLVVDTSVLVSELLRTSGQARLARPELDLSIAEHTLDDVVHELPRRLAAIAERGAMTQDRISYLTESAATAVSRNLRPIARAVYEPLEAEALRRCPRDANDWHVVAAALALECAVWTSDRDFLGTGVATWTTQTLDAWLLEQAPIS